MVMEITFGMMCAGAILLFVGYLVWTQIKESQSNKLHDEACRREGRSFSVTILIKDKPRGRITFEKNHLDIYGRTLFNDVFGIIFGDKTASFRVHYSDIKSVSCQTNSHSGSDIVRITDNQGGAISLRSNEPEDAYRIETVVRKHMDDFSRKVELEKLIRSRYRAGIIDDITPYDFEKLIGELFTFMGYSVIRIGGSGDGGVDLQCMNQQREKVIVQCKRYKSKVGVGTVRDFYGALIHRQAVKGYIVCTSEFTKGAIAWKENKPIELIDKIRLTELLMKYYR